MATKVNFALGSQLFAGSANTGEFCQEARVPFLAEVDQFPLCRLQDLDEQGLIEFARDLGTRREFRVVPPQLVSGPDGITLAPVRELGPRARAALGVAVGRRGAPPALGSRQFAGTAVRFRIEGDASLLALRINRRRVPKGEIRGQEAVITLGWPANRDQVEEVRAAMAGAVAQLSRELESGHNNCLIMFALDRFRERLRAAARTAKEARAATDRLAGLGYPVAQPADA